MAGQALLAAFFVVLIGLLFWIGMRTFFYLESSSTFPVEIYCGIYRGLIVGGFIDVISVWRKIYQRTQKQ